MQKLLITILLFNVTNIWSASHHPQEFLKSIAGASDEGEQIVHHFCVTCHGMKPMIRIGAPRVRQPKDWGKRVKQGLNVLFLHTDEGFHAMPARGGCFECTDKQLMLAILALLPRQDKADAIAHLQNNVIK